MLYPIPKPTYDPISTQNPNYIHSQAHSPIQQLIQTGLAQLAEQQRQSDSKVLATFQSDLQQLEIDLQSHLRLLTNNVEQLAQIWRETMPNVDSSLNHNLSSSPNSNHNLIPSPSLETTTGEDSLSLLSKAVTCITQQQVLIANLVSASETQQQAISDLESKLDDLTQLSTTCNEQVDSLLQQLRLLSI